MPVMPDETNTTETETTNEPNVTTTWCVYHLIHVHTLYKHIPKLVITDVPRDVEVTEDTIERAGYLFGEFDIPRANHVLAEVDPWESPSDLIGRIRQGGFASITYDDLVSLAEKPI